MCRWRVRLVVTKQTQRYAVAAVKNLIQCGVDEIEIYSPRGVSLNINDTDLDCLSGPVLEEARKDIENLSFEKKLAIAMGEMEEEPDEDEVTLLDRIMSRVKLPREDTFFERTKVVKPPHVIESLTYAMAVESIGSSDLSTVDFFMVVGAELALWYGIKSFLEQTMLRNRICLYFAHTPKVFFSACEYASPRSGEGLIGWSKFLLDEPIDGCRFVAGNKHTFMIMSSLIKESKLSDPALWSDEPWGYRFQQVMSTSDITCFSATRSLAFRRGDVADQEWAIPQSAQLGDVSGFEVYFRSGV